LGLGLELERLEVAVEVAVGKAVVVRGTEGVVRVAVVGKAGSLVRAAATAVVVVVVEDEAEPSQVEEVVTAVVVET
jgi:hypothetical protein